MHEFAEAHLIFVNLNEFSKLQVRQGYVVRLSLRKLRIIRTSLKHPLYVVVNKLKTQFPFLSTDLFKQGYFVSVCVVFNHMQRAVSCLKEASCTGRRALRDKSSVQQGTRPRILIGLQRRGEGETNDKHVIR